MKTQFAISFQEVTVNGNENRSTKWFNSKEEIPAQYLGYAGEGNGLCHSAELVTRELAPMPSLAEMRAKKFSN